MIKRRIPALLLALSPLWVSASVYAEEVTQADPVAAIDEKLSNKQMKSTRFSPTTRWKAVNCNN